MNIEEVGSRGVMFTYECGDSVYLINADNRIYLCDTYLGPQSMNCVKEYIDTHQLTNKEIIIFNSHSDWDHIWGNCAFEHATIIGHKECKKRMQERGEFDLLVQGKHSDGDVELKLPNVTFDSRLTFEDDEVEFIYAPGHTICSSICFDRKDSVLYVGDLAESPIPFLNHYNLKPFIESLEFIKSLSAEIIIATHSGIVDEKLIDENLEYVKNVFHGKPANLEDEMSQIVHNLSIRHSLVLKCDAIAREKLEEQFDFESHRHDLWNLLNTKFGNSDIKYWNLRPFEYEDIEKALEIYMAGLVTE